MGSSHLGRDCIREIPFCTNMRYSLLLKGFLVILITIHTQQHVSAVPVVPVAPINLDLGEHHDDALSLMGSSSEINPPSHVIKPLTTNLQPLSGREPQDVSNPANQPQQAGKEKLTELQVEGFDGGNSSTIAIIVGVSLGTAILGAVGILVGMAIHNVMWLRKQRNMRDAHETSRAGPGSSSNTDGIDSILS